MHSHKLIIVSLVGFAVPASAQTADEGFGESPEALSEVTKGAFLPFTDTPGSDITRATSHTLYDGSRDRLRVETVGQARLTSRIQLEAGVTFENADTDASLAAQFTVLRQDTSAIDLQLAGGWDGTSANRTSAVFAEAAAGRNVAGNYILGSARFDVGADERGMQVGLAGVRPIAGGISAGIDSRLTVDLEPDTMIAMNESSWSLLAGPVVTYADDRVAVIGSVGFSANEPNATNDAEAGAYASVGLGVGF